MYIVDWLKEKVKHSSEYPLAKHIYGLRDSLIYRVKRFIRFWQLTGQICWERDVFSLAQSLSYVTVLSLVPLFIIFFFVIGSITKDQQQLNSIVNLVSKFFLPDHIARVTDLLNQLSHQAVGLGLIGFPTLLVIGVFLYLKVDFSINRLWSTLEVRSVFKSFAAFINGALIGPILVIALLSIPTYFKFIPFDQFGDYQLIQYLETAFLSIAPFITTLVLFTLLYYFVPTERVSFKSSIIGSFWISIMVRITNLLLEIYLRNFSKYDLIYGPLTMLPVIMLWLYTMWLMILFGSVLVYVHQTFSHKKFVLSDKNYVVDSNLHISIKVLMLLTNNYLKRMPPPDLLSLCYTFNVDKERLQKIMRQLFQKDIVVKVTDKQFKSNIETKYQLACDPSKVKMSEILNLYLNTSDYPYISRKLNNFFRKLELHPYISDSNSTLLDVYKISKKEATKLTEFLVDDKSFMLHITDLKVNTHLGINDWEKRVKQSVLIDFKVIFDGSQVAASGDINKTINYSSVSKSLQQMIAKNDYLLIETMLDDVVEFLRSQNYAKAVWAKITKPGALPAATNVSMEKQCLITG